MTRVTGLQRLFEIDSAMRVLERRAETSGDPRHWREYAAYARANDHHDSAVAALQRAIALQPESAASKSARFELADLLIERGDLDRARLEAREIDDPALRELVEAALLFRFGAYSEALVGFDRALATWPGNPGARFMAGEAARLLGEPDRAIVEYTEAIRSDPIATPAAHRLTDLLRARGQAEAALSLLSTSFERSAQVVGADHARGELAYRAGRIAHELGRANRALAWLERCLAIDPEHAAASNDLAWLLASRGQDLERAHALAEHAAERMPSPTTQDTLEYVRQARKQATEAGIP